MSVRLSVVRIACPSMEWMSGCDSCAQKLRRFTGSGDMSGVSSLDFFGVRGVSATETTHLKDPGGGGVGTRPRYLIVCLWQRLLASHHCPF